MDFTLDQRMTRIFIKAVRTWRTCAHRAESWAIRLGTYEATKAKQEGEQEEIMTGVRDLNYLE